MQHDRIRRRNDGGKWKLLPDQVFNGSPGQKSMAFVMSTDGENRKLERTNPSSQEASAMPLPDAESLHSRSERIYGSGGRIGPEERGAQHSSDNSSPLKTQYGSDVSSQSGLSELRVGRTEGNETINSTEYDSTGHLSSSLNSLQAGNDLKSRDTVTHNQESCLGDARVLDSSCMVPESSVNNKPASWKNPEGFWMENDNYFMHGDFVQDASLPSDSEFLLKGYVLDLKSARLHCYHVFTLCTLDFLLMHMLFVDVGMLVVGFMVNSMCLVHFCRVIFMRVVLCCFWLQPSR